MEIWVQGQEPSEVHARHSVTSTKKRSPAVTRAPCTTHDRLDGEIQAKKDLGGRYMQIPLISVLTVSSHARFYFSRYWSTFWKM